LGATTSEGVPHPCVFCKGGYHGRVIWMIRVRRALGVKVQTIHTPDLKGRREVFRIAKKQIQPDTRISPLVIVTARNVRPACGSFRLWRRIFSSLIF
jgi:hypothetical protein